MALVVPSGSGKSTIFLMIEHFTVTQRRYRKLDSREICPDHLRTQMALVGQEPRLFSGSIKVINSC